MFLKPEIAITTTNHNFWFFSLVCLSLMFGIHENETNFIYLLRRDETEKKEEKTFSSRNAD